MHGVCVCDCVHLQLPDSRRACGPFDQACLLVGDSEFGKSVAVHSQERERIVAVGIDESTFGDEAVMAVYRVVEVSGGPGNYTCASDTVSRDMTMLLDNDPDEAPDNCGGSIAVFDDTVMVRCDETVLVFSYHASDREWRLAQQLFRGFHADATLDAGGGVLSLVGSVVVVGMDAMTQVFVRSAASNRTQLWGLAAVLSPDWNDYVGPSVGVSADGSIIMSGYGKALAFELATLTVRAPNGPSSTLFDAMAIRGLVSKVGISSPYALPLLLDPTSTFYFPMSLPNLAPAVYATIASAVWLGSSSQAPTILAYSTSVTPVGATTELYFGLTGLKLETSADGGIWGATFAGVGVVIRPAFFSCPEASAGTAATHVVGCTVQGRISFDASCFWPFVQGSRVVEGGVTVTGTSGLVLLDSEVSSVTSYADGGCVAISDIKGNGHVYIVASLLTRCSAPNGGALAIIMPDDNDRTMLVRNTVMTYNTASLLGGAMYVSAELYFKSNLIQNNCAGSHGGGAYFTTFKPVDAYSHYRGNTAGEVSAGACSGSGRPTSGHGGNIACAAAQLGLFAVALDSGTAGLGGGLFVGEGCKAVVHDVAVSNNVAAGVGGGVACTLGTLQEETTSAGLAVVNNTAAAGGGGMFYHDCSVELRYSSVVGNSVEARTAWIADAFDMPRGSILGGGGGVQNVMSGFEETTGCVLGLVWQNNSAPVGGALATVSRAEADHKSGAVTLVSTELPGPGIAWAWQHNVARLVPPSSSVFWQTEAPQGTFNELKETVPSFAVGSAPHTLAEWPGRALPREYTTGVALPELWLRMADAAGILSVPLELSVTVEVSVSSWTGGPGVATPQLAGSRSATFDGTRATLRGVVLLAAPGTNVTLRFSSPDELGVLSLLHTMHIAPCPAGSAPQGTSCTPCSAGRASANGSSCVLCEAGSYASNVGQMQCTKCPRGTFLPTTGATSSAACRACVDGATTDTDGARAQADCSCTPGLYMQASGVCAACEGPITCPATGTTTATLRLAPGFWRTSNVSEIVLECYNPARCLGTPTVLVARHQPQQAAVAALRSHVPIRRALLSSPSRHHHPRRLGAGDAMTSVVDDTSPLALCAAGSSGPFCDVCLPGWQPSEASGLCEECESASGLVLALQLLALVAAAAVVVAGAVWGRRRVAMLRQEARVTMLQRTGSVVLDKQMESEAAREAYGALVGEVKRLSSKLGSIGSKVKIVLSYMQVTA
mgnify:CR=1 FL=1